MVEGEELEPVVCAGSGSPPLSFYWTLREEVVAEGDNLIISGTVIIQPPYTHQACDAPNEIILARIRNILKSI